MLSPIDTEPKEMRLTAYDLEWWPKTLEIRLVGVYDERGYRSYLTVPEFLEAELSDENRGRYFFAHAGGNFDVQEVLQVLAKNPRFEVSASFSGSSAVIVAAKQGKHVWTFADSYFVLRDSLGKVGKAIGLAKGECAFDAPLSELRDYNKRDCEIVFQGLNMLRDELETMGGELRPTLAACAMRLFRRRYLKRSIQTSERVNRIMRAAYCASRVEVFTPVAPAAEYFDINSSFPYSMTKPQPGKLLKIRHALPPSSSALYFAECEVTVPPQYLPPLPYRHGSRIFFPTGTWRAWFAKPDLELLEETGGKIETVFRSYEFEPFDDLGAYVDDVYARKVQAERENDPFRRFTYKLLLNSLYGKFGERREKKKLLLNPASTRCPHRGEHEDDSCLELISPGIYLLTEESEVEHSHVPVAAYVTSLSRALLHGVLSKCETLYYADTDSAICGKGEALPTSDKLGALKHEGSIRNAKFLGAKVYAFTTDCDACKGAGCEKCKGAGEVRTVKSKGFRRLSADEFGKLENFEAVKIERMAGVREGLRHNGTFGRSWSPVTEKRLHKNVTPKRCKDGENSTRPWDVDELADK